MYGRGTLQLPQGDAVEVREKQDGVTDEDARLNRFEGWHGGLGVLLMCSASVSHIIYTHTHMYT